MFSKAAFLPIGVALADFLSQGMEEYKRYLKEDLQLSPETLSVYLAVQMREWHPTIRGKAILDDTTKKAGARFLAGVIFNMSAKD